MDRLEQILHAEDKADKALDAAREQARSTVAQAKSEAGLVLSDSEREARAEAARIEERALSQSQKEAEALAQAESAQMRSLIESVEGNVAATADVVVKGLTG